MTRTRVLLAAIITTGFFVVMISIGMGFAVFDADNQFVLVLVGALSSSYGQVVSWFFGSSEGSSRKTDLIAKKEPV